MSLAEMPNTSSSVPKASPEDASAYARLSGDPDFLNLDDDEKVEALLYEGWEVSRIARTLRMRRDDVQQYCDRIDEDMESALEESPAAIRKRHSRMLRTIAANVMASPKAREELRPYAIAIKALSDERKMLGLDAPSQSVTLSLNTVVSDEQQQAFIDDPVIRQHTLAMEQRYREIEAQGARHLAGPVRRTRQQRPLEVHDSPVPAERQDAEGGDGPDRPADDLDAAAAREVGLPLDVLPGLVSGDLPRSEGHPG
jgi:hypothetical protein